MSRWTALHSEHPIENWIFLGRSVTAPSPQKVPLAPAARLVNALPTPPLRYQPFGGGVIFIYKEKRKGACRCFGRYLSVLRGTGWRDSPCFCHGGTETARSLFAWVKPDKAARCSRRGKVRYSRNAQLRIGHSSPAPLPLLFRKKSRSRPAKGL